MKCVSFHLVAIITTIISVQAKLPDFIRTCKRNDPEIGKCIEDSISSLKEKLRAGIPELGLETIDPMYMDKLVINLGPGLSASGTNLELTGARNLEIKNVVADMDGDTYTFDVVIPEAKARGNYEIDATIASIPLKGKGPISISAKSILGRAKLRGKKVVRNGKTHYYYSSMDLKTQFTDYEMRLERLFEGTPEIGDAINKLLNDEKAEVLSNVIPAVEKALIKLTLTTANKFVTPFTWDELFPPS